MENQFRCGLVALAGLPNAGKSTLLNALLDEKIAITSNKPQTTRNAIQGIKSTDDYQIVFVDTPGYHSGKGRLNKAMVQQAEEVILGVDLICLLVDPSERGGSSFDTLLEKVADAGVPVMLVLTKSDNRSKESLFKSAETFSKLHDFIDVVPISATKKRNLDTLETIIVKNLPEQPAVYDPELLTTQTESFIISEFIREQVFRLLHQEVPYDIIVDVESVNNSNKGLEINAAIIVAKDSQKGIVIGKNGAMIKEIGINSRKELEKFFGVSVRLELFVKVRDNWESKDEYLKIQGL